MADDSDNEIMSDSSVDDVDDDDVEVDSIYESENSSVDSDSDVSDDSPAPRRKRLRTLPPCATTSATATGGQVPSTSAPAPGAPGATASVAGQLSSTTGRDLLVKFTSKTLTGKNGHRWSTKPVARSSSRVPRRNLLPAFNYASPTQRFIDPSPTRCFEEFFTIDILHEILTHPNTHKPEMVLCYNKTKGAVDVFDQMCARYSCSRKTRRWPLCMFYGMLNAATINTWIIYNRMQKDRGQPEMERRKFMMNLAEDLIFPWAQEWMYFQGLQRSTQMTIRDVYNINIPHQRAAQGDNTMKRCVFCLRKKDRKTRQQCVHCQRPVCGDHATPICSDCI